MFLKLNRSAVLEILVFMLGQIRQICLHTVLA